MNRIEVGVQSMDLSTLFKEDKVAKTVVYHVYEIEVFDDWGKRPALDKMLKHVCRQFRNLAIEYNRTPRYTVAKYWDGMDDMLSDFKEGHVAKMLRELDLMMYWDIFEQRMRYFEQYALDPDLFAHLKEMGVQNGDHIDKMMQHFSAGMDVGEMKTFEKLRIADKRRRRA